MNSEHDRHDRVLVARYAAGDAYPSEQDQAQRLVDGCDECSALAADIKLISARTAELPALRRPRDFRISPEQADRLRGSWFERFLRGFSTPGWSVVRPLAGAALAIGFALVIVGSLPLGNLNGGNVPEANPATTSQAAGLSGAQPSIAPQVAAATESLADQAYATPPAPPSPASAPVFGAPGTASSTPGAGVELSSSAPPDVDSSQPLPRSPTTAPPPPKAVESPVQPQATPVQAFVAPTAAPTPPPVLHSSVPPASVGLFEGSWLIVGGLVIAFLALIILALVWVARRRYSDPLIR